MARNTYAANNRARKHPLTARQLKALRIIREGAMVGTLVHHTEWTHGRERFTLTVLELADKGVVAFEHTDEGVELRLVS